MKILFDITHPAHVHLFKHAIWELKNERHEIIVTSRDKDVTTDLLDAYDIDYLQLSSSGTRTFDILGEWIQREYKMLNVARSFSPDVMIARYNPVVAHVSKIVGSRNLLFKSSNVESLVTKFTYPFCDTICTPKNINLDFDKRGKQYKIDALQEVAYLHPDYFEPDRELLQEYDVPVDSNYYILRFISWRAHHDIGQHGFSKRAKKKLIKKLDERGTVFITTESELPASFEEYKIPTPPHLIHDLMYYANLYAGDSQTMATEAGLLGTPSIRSNTFAGSDDMIYFKILEEDYELVYSFEDENEAIDTALSLEKRDDIKEEWQKKAAEVMNSQENMTEIMINLILGVNDYA